LCSWPFGVSVSTLIDLFSINGQAPAPLIAEGLKMEVDLVRVLSVEPVVIALALLLDALEGGLEEGLVLEESLEVESLA